MTTRIGIMASHEQVNANDLLSDVIVMDKNGLERCWVSDHYMPWWHDGGFAGATWPWLGAALAKTDKIHIGTSVTAPILRYHPAIVAQVFATLGFMFPNRVFLTVGTGGIKRSPFWKQVAIKQRKIRKTKGGNNSNQKAMDRRMG